MIPDSHLVTVTNLFVWGQGGTCRYRASMAAQGNQRARGREWSRTGWAALAIGPAGPPPAGEQLQVPVAVALFREHWPKEWAERVYRDLRRFTEMPRGGHFPALEEPELLAKDQRGFFRGLR